jgi:hypothetical protein
MTGPSVLLSLLLTMLPMPARAADSDCRHIALQWRHYTSFERLSWQAMVDAGRNGQEGEANRWEGVWARHGASIRALSPAAARCGVSTGTERKTERHPLAR